MSITKPIALAFLLLTSACVSTTGSRGSREAARKPLKGGIAELRVSSYDGRDLTGRVLLGATVDPLVVDGRMCEWVDVELENLRVCDEDKKERLPHWVWESLPPPPRTDQIITIRPGYWYGGKVLFMLFDKETTTGLGPECFEAELVVRAVDGRVAARQMIRVVRTDKAPTTKDRDTEGTKTRPSDAGTP